MVSTALAIVCPEETYGRVVPRSDLAVKQGIFTDSGVIDAGYRGEVKSVDFQVEKGDRIAQLILESTYTPEVEVLDDAAWIEENNTERGAGGFGSTGKN